MKVLFPDGLDFSLSPSRANKNLVEQSNRFTQDDVLYILDELEKKVGVDSSTDTDSHDYKLNRLSGAINFGTANQIIGMNSGASGLEFKTFVEGSGITITHGAGTVTISSSGGGAVSSVSNSDGTLTISPTTGAVVASLNLSHANTWNAQQVMKSGADGTPALIAQQWSVTDTANIFQCKQSTGTVIAWVTSAGDIHGEDHYGDLYLFNDVTGRIGNYTTPCSIVHLKNGSSIQGLAGGNPDDVDYTILYFDTVSGAKNIKIPAASGTMAVSASGNIALSSTTGNITFTGTLAVGSGGTGATTLTSNGVLYGNGTGAIQVTAAGTSGYLLYSNAGVPAWTNTPSVSTLTLSSKLVSPSITPSSDSTAAIQIRKADNTSIIVTIDSTNRKVGLTRGGSYSTPQYALHLRGASEAWQWGGMWCEPTANSNGGTDYNTMGGNGAYGFRFYGTGYSKPYASAQVDLNSHTASPINSVIFYTGDGTVSPTQRLLVDGSGNVVIGTAALATNATSGFLYIPTCAGTPTGVPTTYTGRVAMIFDTTNNKFYIYDGGWISVTLA